MSRRALFAFASLLLAPAAGAVTIDWVTVGAPGNPADDTGYGAVAYEYRIGRTEVTTGQYVEFLNAIAADDPNGVMINGQSIVRSGASGSYIYSVAASFVADTPVAGITYHDAVRFVNWMHNGQPVGAQGPGTTEDGAYTISGASVGPRTTGATIFLPSEDEWYKAAYYDPDLSLFWEYPTGSDVAPACVAPSADDGNAALCFPASFSLTSPFVAGAYALSGSPFGTFDQAGSLWEMTDTVTEPLPGQPEGDYRVGRGGSAINGADETAAGSRTAFGVPVPGGSLWQDLLGFRVASVPEPATAVLLALGLAALAARGRR